jgi:capsular polysaccharide biosynthesis protein
VAEKLGLENLKDFDLLITSSTTTRVLTLSVTGTDAELATSIANGLVADASDVASEVMKIESVNVIDSATVPIHPSGPRRQLYTLVGLLAGLFCAIAIVVVQDMLDTRIHSSEELREIIDVPVLGHIPRIDAPGKERN